MQMISLLLDNAVKYTPEGGTIQFSVTDKAGHIWIVEENTCEPLSDIDPERLFERFYRGDSARTQATHPPVMESDFPPPALLQRHSAEN